MLDISRSVLLREAMEQAQTVSIAQGRENARTSAVLALLGQPSGISLQSQHECREKIIKLPTPPLSRFDLNYLILVSPNTEHDRCLNVA
jgi:DNA replicative helicase MCM subunit Mcm2 (Cdc46/Mcm family)